MITIEAKNELRIEGLSEDQAQSLKNFLTIMNPKWDIASRMNKSLFGIPSKLKYYREDGQALIAPVGVLPALRKMYPDANITDKRFKAKKKINITFNGKLHDYQEEAVTEMLKDPNGVLCAKTGSGKTVMMIKMICELKEPTLILVHTVELANQFRSSLVKFTNLSDSEIGFVGDGKRDFKDITVALLQTVVTLDPALLNDKFSSIFVDEVHIAPADTYASAMSRLEGYHKYGASATPERADGLTKVIFWLTGPLRYQVEDSKLTATIIKPIIKTIDTNYYFPLFDTSEYQDMISDLSTNTERNELILKALDEYKTEQVVLLCQRVSHVEALSQKIPGSVCLTSSMGKKERKAVMSGLVDQTYRIVISTYQLFSTGIDIPTLEILFMCAPIRSNVKVRQSAGRLMRKSSKIPNKQPIIVDFIDKRVELLKHQAYERTRIFRTL